MGVTKEKKNFVIVGDFSLSFLKVIQVLVNSEASDVGEQEVVLVRKMVMVFANKMIVLVHLLANLSRRRQIPLCYCRDSSDSEGNDGTLCSICQNNEPEGLASGVVFWVDCND